MNKSGIYYIATGKQFVEEAEVSAKYVREAMPTTPIAIATDVEPNFDFDHVIGIESPSYGFVDQIENLHRSPFRKTLHFDTDIYVNSDVSELFDLLDQFNIAVSHNHNREVYHPPGVPESFPEFNTGVVVYRNDEKIKEFIHRWKKNYTSLSSNSNSQNQPSFRKTLYESDIRFATFNPEYNCMVRYPGHVRNKVKIAHSRLLNIKTPGAENYMNVKNAVKTLNSHLGHRLYVPHKKGVAIRFGYKTESPSAYSRFVNSIKSRGVKITLKRSLYLVVDRLSSMFSGII